MSRFFYRLKRDHVLFFANPVHCQGERGFLLHQIYFDFQFYVLYGTIHMDWFKELGLAQGFEWDPGNVVKSARKHQVSCEEAEQVFFNRPLLLIDDPGHSKNEPRAKMFGMSHDGRELIVSFTIRKSQIRIISARAMNRKERKVYEEQGE